MTTQQQIGNRIRSARERIGMTQEDFAIAAKKDQRAISEYENGKRKISAVELAKFASILQVPPAFFFEGVYTIDELDQLLLKEFHRLPSDDAKHTVLSIVKILTKAFKESSS